jgi:DNA-directed RNA polymerase omega subunit
VKQQNIPLEELLPASGGSRFKLTLLASKRALELADGAKLLVERVGEKPLDNAIQEIFAGKVKVKAKAEKAAKAAKE